MNKRNKAIVEFENNNININNDRSYSPTKQHNNDKQEDTNELVIPKETDILICTAMRYVLMHESDKKPISRFDIQKFLTEHHIVDKTMLVLIMQEVCIIV